MIRIVILDKGFVAVGKFAAEKDDWFKLTDGAIIRRWGTTKGLGEIAENGPTPSTILDKAPTMHFPRHSIVTTIECMPSKWKKALE